MSEREKRQAIERERDELKQKLSEREAADKPKTSVFEDEAKWSQERREEIQLQLDNQRYSLSHELAVDKFGREKVDQAFEAFKALSAENKELAGQVFDAPLPYFEMVRIIERQEKAKELENIDEYRERIRAEERQKLIEEQQAEAEAKIKKREGITPSLASARSTGGTKDTDHLMTAEELLPE